MSLLMDFMPEFYSSSFNQFTSNSVKKSKKKPDVSKSAKIKRSTLCMDQKNAKINHSFPFTKILPNSSSEYQNKLNIELNLSYRLIERDTREICIYLKHLRNKLKELDLKSKKQNEWKIVALVLDRTLFYVYILVMFFYSSIIFFDSKIPIRSHKL